MNLDEEFGYDEQLEDEDGLQHYQLDGGMLLNDENLLEGLCTPRENEIEANEQDSAMSTPMFNRHLKYDSRMADITTQNR